MKAKARKSLAGSGTTKLYSQRAANPKSSGKFYLTNGSGKRLGRKRFRTKDSAVAAGRAYLRKSGRKIKVKVWKDA
jgi:hypothetical protein